MANQIDRLPFLSYIFKLLIPLLKSQCLQNKISYTGITFCRSWGIITCFYWLWLLIFTILQLVYKNICKIFLFRNYIFHPLPVRRQIANMIGWWDFVGDCKLVLTKWYFMLMNTFKIDGSTMRTHSNESLATHWHSLILYCWALGITIKNMFLVSTTIQVK